MRHKVCSSSGRRSSGTAGRPPFQAEDIGSNPVQTTRLGAGEVGNQTIKFAADPDISKGQKVAVTPEFDPRVEEHAGLTETHQAPATQSFTNGLLV